MELTVELGLKPWHPNWVVNVPSGILATVLNTCHRIDLRQALGCSVDCHICLQSRMNVAYKAVRAFVGACAATIPTVPAAAATITSQSYGMQRRDHSSNPRLGSRIKKCLLLRSLHCGSSAKKLENGPQKDAIGNSTFPQLCWSLQSKYVVSEYT